MNARTIIATLMLAPLTVAAQDVPEAQVPAPVLEHFKKTFPNAIDVEWERKGSQYQVEFETGVLERENEAWYDASGKLLRHEEEVPASGLPAAVLTAIQRDFAGFAADDAEKVTMGGVVSYVVKLKAHKQKLKVVFDASGKVLEKVGG